MSFLFLRKIRWIELLAIIIVGSLLASCNISPPSKVSGSNANHTEKVITPITSTSSTTMPPVNTGSIAVNEDNLHIQTNDVITCSPGNHDARWPPNHLVLATDRTTYNSSETQQITDYVDALLQTDETTGSIANISTPFPSTLGWATGGIGYCLTELEVTNTGGTTIQVPQVDVRLMATPQQNIYRYRLIDACSLSLKTPCKCGECGSGGGNCSLYSANIQLGMGQQNSLFSATPSSDSSCGEMTLKSGSTLTLFLSFKASPPTPLIYSLTTELTLQTANSQQILALPQLGHSVAFASSSQFSCYALQGQSFVQESLYPSAPGANCI